MTRTTEFRKIVVTGWDGWSRPIYRFYDERDAHPQYVSKPTASQILEQYPNADFSRPAWLTACGAIDTCGVRR